MRKVLHYKTNYLNKSETFIDRLVRNYQRFEPAALCYRKRSFSDGLAVFQAPGSGIEGVINTSAFHLNLPLPYYRKVIRTYKPDVIHTHFGFDGVKIMRIASEENLPHIISFYGSDVSRLPSERGWIRRYRKLSRLGTVFIAASRFMKKQLADLGFPPEKIHIVRFGVDMENSAFSNACKKTPDFMMVGRMVEKKGFQYAIEAISSLHRAGVDAKLNIYGDGPLMKSLVRLTRDLSMQNHVFFHGYKPVKTILEAHNNHSVLLAPSITSSDGDMEGLPNTILEAMAKGTPVVATRHAAIPEVVEHLETGFLVEERDSKALADTLLSILRGQFDVEQVRVNARRKVEKEYGVEQMVREVETIYEKALLRLPSSPSPAFTNGSESRRTGHPGEAAPVRKETSASHTE